MQKVASLLLTAGSSSRMGKPKALLPWGPISVVRHILNQIERVGLHNVLLVTGAHHQEILKEVQDSHTRICYHPQWELGMGSSIVAGVAVIEREFPETESILILLVDQPLLSSAYLQKILNMHRQNSKALIASDYGPFAGVPALFPKKCVPYSVVFRPRLKSQSYT